MCNLLCVFVKVKLVYSVLVCLYVCDDVFGSLQHGLLDRLLHGVSGREAADESTGGMLQ